MHLDNNTYSPIMIIGLFYILAIELLHNAKTSLCNTYIQN